jgi:hypothetical protein
MALPETWLAPADLAVPGDRVDQAVTRTEQNAALVNEMSLEVRDAITAFRLQLHLDDDFRTW